MYFIIFKWIPSWACSWTELSSIRPALPWQQLCFLLCQHSWLHLLVYIHTYEYIYTYTVKFTTDARPAEKRMRKFKAFWRHVCPLTNAHVNPAFTSQLLFFWRHQQSIVKSNQIFAPINCASSWWKTRTNGFRTTVSVVQTGDILQREQRNSICQGLIHLKNETTRTNPLDILSSWCTMN